MLGTQRQPCSFCLQGFFVFGDEDRAVLAQRLQLLGQSRRTVLRGMPVTSVIEWPLVARSAPAAPAVAVRVRPDLEQHQHHCQVTAGNLVELAQNWPRLLCDWAALTYRNLAQSRWRVDG